MTAITLFLIFLLTGLILLGAEVFVPGGVLGVMGAIGLVGAVIIGFAAFGPTAGAVIAFGILVLSFLAMYLWIRFFPRSPIGRSMTVSLDLKSAKATEDGLPAMAGRPGVAVSELRPSGFATIDGRRVDVITEGSMLSRGTAIRVVRVEGNRVVVEADAAGDKPAAT